MTTPSNTVTLQVFSCHVLDAVGYSAVGEIEPIEMSVRQGN